MIPVSGRSHAIMTPVSTRSNCGGSRRTGKIIEGRKDGFNLDISAAFKLTEEEVHPFTGDGSRSSAPVWHHKGRQSFIGARYRFRFSSLANRSPERDPGPASGNFRRPFFIRACPCPDLS
jgi:hypothetical protein